MSHKGGKLRKQIWKVVHKATSHHMRPAKEKYIKDVILRTGDRNANEEIIKALMVRMEKHNWIVVLKALTIFHRCFVAGEEEFMAVMEDKSSQVFMLSTFKSRSPTSSPGPLTTFITKYAKYLDEKVSVVRLLGYQFEKNRNISKEIDLNAALKFIPKLQSQLNALCNCKIRSTPDNPLIIRSYMMLIKDSLVLYTMLHDSMVQLVELFWKIEKKLASKILQMYKLYVRETKVLIVIYDGARKKFFKELPTLNEAEESMIESMEKYVENLEEEDDDGSKVQEEIVTPEDIPEELISTTPGSSFVGSINDNYTNNENSDSSESSVEDEPIDNNDDIFKSIIQDFPNPSFGNQSGDKNDLLSIFKPTSVPHNTATYEEKISFIKSIPQTIIPMTNQSLQSPNPFGIPQTQQNNHINPFSDMVNPFANVIVSMTNQQTYSISNNEMGNPFTQNLNQGSNPFMN